VAVRLLVNHQPGNRGRFNPAAILEREGVETMNDTKTASKENLVEMLRRFIAQRSGIDRRNYQSDWRDTAGAAAFATDYREILRDGRDARRLLEYVAGRHGITAAQIVNATSGNGRLEFVYAGDGLRLDYCTGQYFATEYRAAACSMLAAIVWRYLADDYENDGAAEVRKAARRIFGRGVASRWFS
jgi:hypothetical protein